MNALLGLAILAAILYGILFDGLYWRIYGCCVLVYLVFVICSTNKRDNHKRRIITLSTWNRKSLLTNYPMIEPSDPTSYLCCELNMTKAIEYVK